MTRSLSSIDLLAFITDASADKVVGSFDLLTATRSVSAASSLGGGFYSPKSDTYTIANPYGKKATITMVWSIDGINFYPQKPWIYQPGPTPYSTVGATMGAMVDDNYIHFISVHYIASTVNFTMYYVLDFIDE